MKYFHSLFLVANCAIILSSCMKDVSKSSDATKISQASLVQPFSIPIIKEQAATLNTMVVQGKIATPADFRKAVYALVSSSQKNAVNNGAQNRALDDGDYSDGTDNESFEIFADWESGDYDIDAFPNYVVYSKFEDELTFGMRGNTMRIIVPFMYDLGTIPGGTKTINNIRQYLPVQLLPEGGSWGEVTPGAAWYVNGGPGSNIYQQSSGVDAYGTAQEKRTKIISTSGKVKISANADIEVFKIGEELEVGFTIQSVYNIYNQYSMNATGQIWVSQTPTTSGIPPTQFIGNILAIDNGIQKND